MLTPRIEDYSDCSEFRQTLHASPPAIVRGLTWLLVALVAAAVAWSAWTKADLVVRAGGRVRPIGTPVKIICMARGEVLSASHGGRVIEVHAREGATVRRGDVLIRLDTTRLVNELAKCQGKIQAAQEELNRIGRLDKLLAVQFEAARLKAEAELAEAVENITAAKVRQAAEVRLAESEIRFAGEDLRVVEALAKKQAASQSDLEKARQTLRRAESTLEKAKLPLDEGRAAVMRRALAIVEKNYAVSREELAEKQSQAKTDEKTARIELASLELEREQSMLRAPIDGVVTVGDVKVGDALEPNRAVMEIAALEGFRFEASVPTDEVAHVRAGMPANIKLDAYDYQKYGTVAGIVESVSPDSELIDGRRKHAYLVRIDVQDAHFGRGEWQGQLKLGMAGQAELVTGRESVLSLLLKKVRQSISLG